MSNRKNVPGGHLEFLHHFLPFQLIQEQQNNHAPNQAVKTHVF
jgi:hypothetical protein